MRYELHCNERFHYRKSDDELAFYMKFNQISLSGLKV